MVTKTRKVETLIFDVPVLQRDIDDAECRNANKCMIRVATERELRRLEPDVSNHYTHVDGSIIRFHYHGYHYKGMLPAKPKRSLITWDAEEKARKKAEKSGLAFVSKVTPFNFKVRADRGVKVQTFTSERRQQINEARRNRVLEGRPDKSYTLRKRIIGLS